MKHDKAKKLYAVLFISRTKDNEDVENFKERKVSFLHYLKGSTDIESLSSTFNRFVNAGVAGETSRMYVSINARDPEKVQKQLIHYAIDNELPLDHMDGLLVSLAMQKCAAERKWLFDFDSQDTKLLAEFEDELFSMLKEDAKVSDIVASQLIKHYKTPHGYAVVVYHGLDIHKLSTKFQELLKEKDGITLKKDDMLCTSWATK